MEFLPQSVQDGLAEAQRRASRRASRLRIEVGGERIRVLRSWETGFAVDASAPAHLRGVVDLYDGPRLLSRCLIITSRESDGERVYEFKRSTAAADKPPLDFETPETAPSGLLAGPEAY
ncbi:hypothetical protein [Roseisalinus antarcticus]|uniref:Uncharacterized protein n=1 Tax=Roseisalinus antarcticus TaxID=254357 RepID=A0A1Y5ST69_9RHOB|nr:hypothetical protein [Roseisalinus antarcticus]SLN44668.1 hypothetical protein ROA7023_01842 [Roseisalinus antarcticus]